MPIPVECPSCQARYKAPDKYRGKRVRCPQCKAEVRVPEENGAPAGARRSTSARSTSARSAGARSAGARSAGARSASARTGSATAASLAGPGTAVVEDDPRTATPARSTADSQAPVSAAPPVQAPLPLTDLGDDDDQPPVDFSGREREEGEMDMTPMVDVTFLLLIFFMVTASFALQKAQEVPTPEKTDDPSTKVIEQQPEDNPDFVVVQIDENNTYTVSTPDWEEEAPSDQEMLIMLRRARGGDAHGNVPTKLLVKANGEALHAKVVTAVDAGTEVGMTEVQLMTIEEAE